MTDTSSRTTRVTTLVVAALVAVVIAGVAFGVTHGGAADGATPAAADTPSTSAAAVTSTDAATGSPTPQPTATAALQSAAPITSALTAEIVSMQAVQAKATQPGQVGGPAVRFTIKLTNTGGTAIDLSSTVVDVYSGVDQDPAYQLDSDGLVFPASVAARSSVTGTAVFTIPVDARGQVRVTVDTSATSTVVAFSGAAPE
jgi:hypothetical protein